MNPATVTYALAGIACLLMSGYMMYKSVPREGQPPWSWTNTEFRETSVSLGQFALLIAGLALLGKAVF
jgi:hypothetical protein